MDELQKQELTVRVNNEFSEMLKRLKAMGVFSTEEYILEVYKTIAVELVVRSMVLGLSDGAQLEREAKL